MNKSTIEVGQPEQVTVNEQKADNISVSPSIANANVVGSLKSSNTTKIKIKKGAIISDNMGGKHTVKEEFEAEVIIKQSDYYICKNNGKFQSGLEKVLDKKQSFFVEENDVVGS